MIQLADDLANETDEQRLAAKALQFKALQTLLTIKLKVRSFGIDPDPDSGNGVGEHPIVGKVRARGVES